MGMFRPLVIAFRNGKEMTVTNLADASRALDRLGWADDNSPELMHAAKLVADAMEGRCAPRIAFEVFLAAARKQGMVREVERSVAWTDFESAIRNAS